MGVGTARALFVLESLDALIVKGTALLAHRDMADAQSLSNHHVRLSFPTGQNNLGALHQAVTQAAGTGHGLLLLFLFLTKADGHGGGDQRAWAYSLHGLPSYIIHLSSRTIH